MGEHRRGPAPLQSLARLHAAVARDAEAKSRQLAKWCIRQVGCNFSEAGAFHGAGLGWGGCDDPSGARVERRGGAHAGEDDALTETGCGLVRRARIIQHAVDGLSAPGIAATMGLCGATVRFWLKRFNARGLGGLEEDMRSGCPPTYPAAARSAVIAAALSRPARWACRSHRGRWTAWGLFGREGHRHKAQPGERGPARRGAEVAPRGDLVRRAGGPAVRA